MQKKRAYLKIILPAIILICIYFLSLSLSLKLFLPTVISTINKNAKEFIRYEKIDLKLFPYAGLEFKNLSIKMEKSFTASIKQVDLFLNFLGIPEKFIGIRATDGRVSIININFDKKKDNKPFIIPKIPVEFIELVNFNVNSQVKKIPIHLHKTYTSILLDPKQIKIKALGNANLLNVFEIQATISNTEKNIKAKLDNINLNYLARFLPKQYQLVEKLSGDFNIDVGLDLKDQYIKAIAQLTSKELNLGAKITELTSNLEANIDTKKNQFSILIKGFNTKYPKTHISGNIEINKERIKTNVSCKEINISQLIAFYKNLPFKNHIADKIIAIVNGGEFYNGSFSLLNTKNHTDWELTGQCKNTDILIPHIKLPLKGLAGDLTIKNNILYCRKITGSYRNSKIINGYLDLGLNSDLMPFVIKTNMNFDLNDLTPLLKNLDVSPNITLELDKIKIDSGNCLGQFTLTKDIDKYIWNVSAKNIDVKGKIDKTPFSVTTDLLNLTPNNLYLKNGNIKLKKSNIKNLELKSNFISKDLDLSLKYTKIDIKELKNLAKYLFNYTDNLNVFGQLFFNKLNISYNFTQNKIKNYLFKGSIYSLNVKKLNISKDLPKNLSILVSGGKFNIVPDNIDLSNLNINTLKSKIKLHNLKLQGNIKDPNLIKIMFSGDISDIAQNIAKNFISYLKPIKVSKSIHVNNMTIDKAKSDILVTGRLFLNGVTATLRLDKNPLKLYSNIQLEYGGTRCNIFLNKQGQKYSVKFQGKLTKTILDRLVYENIYLKDKIEGDFSINFSLNPFYITNSNGYIYINSLTIDPSLNLSIIKLSANSTNNKIIIDKSLISLFKDNLNLDGKINIIKDHNELYMRLNSNTLHIDPLIKKLNTKNKKNIQLSLKGSVDFNINKTFYKKRIISDIIGTIYINNGFKELKVSKGFICSLPINIVVKKQKQSYNLKASMKSSHFLIEDTLSCLIPEKKNLITGISNLKLDLSTNIDNGESVTKLLNGEFCFDSKQGRIFKLTLISQILTIINSTEIFFGKIPDLESKGFEYNELQAIGEIKNGTIIFKKSHINGTNMELVFHGKIDLSTKEVNLIILFAPLKTIDRIVKKIPILRNITGGNLLVVPFQAKGTIDSPIIIPLSPKAVGSEALKILKNTFKLPFTIFQPLLPNSN